MTAKRRRDWGLVGDLGHTSAAVEEAKVRARRHLHWRLTNNRLDVASAAELYDMLGLAPSGPPPDLTPDAAAGGDR